jgi:hypothetical protein
VATFAKSNLVLVPYKQNPDFVGRSDILDKIKLQFGLGQKPEHDLSQPRRRVSLYGLGGVGYVLHLG